MERKVQLAEQAATIFHSSLHQDSDDLRRKLEDSRLSERVTQSQMYDSVSGEEGDIPPPLTVGVAMSAENSTNTTNNIVSAVTH